MVRWVARAAGAIHCRAVPGSLRVLLYHSVGSDIPWATYGLSVDAERFTRHMWWLKHKSGCRLVSIEDGVLRVADGVEGPFVAVTFDDGFRDNLEVAAPILCSLGIPFTVFVTAAYLQLGEQGDALYLTKTALKNLANLPGVTVGFHGFSHRPLTQLECGVLHQELLDGKRVLEDITGKPVVTLSYPHGAVNAQIRRAVASCGFRLGATSFFGLNRPDTPPLMLYRTEVLGEDVVEDLRVKVHGGYDWYGIKQRLHWLVPRLQKIGARSR